jgi:hypothetical protein
MAMEFDTAAEEAAKADEPEVPTPITFEPGTKDERVINVYKPNEGQFAMFMASAGRGSTGGDMIGGIINFFIGLLEEEDALYVEQRLMNRRDPFSKKGAEYIQGFLEGLTEVWAGRPTKPLSVSTQSPESDGPKSTPTTPESTSSDSLLISS